jgi:hypothetical protein
MSDVKIETQIRNHYCVDNGEWLVEKGKVKEAKLLKEACITIEKLRKENTILEGEKWNGKWNNIAKERELEEREKSIVKRETRFQTKIDSLRDDLKKWM